MPMADTQEDREPTEDESGEGYADPSQDGADGQVKSAGRPPPATPTPPPRATTTSDRIQQLRELKEKAELGGGQDAIERQHARGKLTARERLRPRPGPGAVAGSGP